MAGGLLYGMPLAFCHSFIVYRGVFVLLFLLKSNIQTIKNCNHFSIYSKWIAFLRQFLSSTYRTQILSYLKMSEPILKYHDLWSDVTAFSTTRHGGFGEGAYSAFNINPYCGDNPRHTVQNLELLCRKLELKPHDVVMPHQTHGTRIKLIEKDFFFKSEEEKARELYGVDALVTKEKRICIGVSTADCVPLLLYDAENEVSAAVHAGWRGTKERFAGKVVAFLRHALSSPPENIRVAIGPCIGREAFEVDSDVWEAFGEAGFNMKEIGEKRGRKWHMDLVQANVCQLVQQGIQKKNIICSDICTFQENSDFFSARRLGILSGRIFNGIIIR